VIYGDYHNADLIKIHVTSGKVSLVRFDDFEGKPLPRMVERVKIKLPEQGVDLMVPTRSVGTIKHVQKNADFSDQLLMSGSMK
jgi:hypothetical protein